MNKKEKQFVAKLLKMASDRFSDRICNDLPKEMREYFTDEEWAKMDLKAAQWNERTETPKDIAELKWYDWYCAWYFARILETEAENIDEEI